MGIKERISILSFLAFDGSTILRWIFEKIHFTAEVFSFGSKIGNMHLTRLRVGRSFLNAHSFEINLSDTNLCNCWRTETVLHYVTECFLYNQERNILYDSMEQYIPNFLSLPNKRKLDILLYGINNNGDEDCRNKCITLAMQNFILQTKRF